MPVFLFHFYGDLDACSAGDFRAEDQKITQPCRSHDSKKQTHLRSELHWFSKGFTVHIQFWDYDGRLMRYMTPSPHPEAAEHPSAKGALTSGMTLATALAAPVLDGMMLPVQITGSLNGQQSEYSQLRNAKLRHFFSCTRGVGARAPT